MENRDTYNRSEAAQVINISLPTLDKLIKCDNPSAFPALRQIEVYGKDC